MDQMQALLKTTPENAELRSVPVPNIGSKDVLVRVRAAALCGSDLHIFNWSPWAQGAGIRLPFVMGHECCGDIAALGDQVEGLAVGDRICVETHVPCGKCYQCLNGEQHICNNLQLFGVHMNGCFAEYAVIPAVVARKIPQEISYEVGSVMEPMGTAFRAALEGEIGGSNLVVLGCGPIGLFAVASAFALGAARIIAVEISSTRMEIAGKMGADIALNPLRDDITKRVHGVTGGYGADVVIEASGNVDALKRSFTYLRKGGRVLLIGLPGKLIELELGREVVFKEAKITGIHGRKMYHTWTRMENLLATGKLVAEPAITHVLPLADWNEGLQLAKSGQACKVVFRP